MVLIPPLEMPQTISKLKEALMPKTVESSSAAKLPDTDSKPQKEQTKSLSEDNPNLPLKTVRRLDGAKNGAKDMTISSSDSFQSAESLRERSSSEVIIFLIYT